MATSSQRHQPDPGWELLAAACGTPGVVPEILWLADIGWRNYRSKELEHELFGRRSQKMSQLRAFSSAIVLVTFSVVSGGIGNREEFTLIT